PLVQHPPAAGPLALLRLRRGRGRDLVRPEDQPPQLRRGGRDARRPLRRPAAVRGRRRGARRPPDFGTRRRLLDAHAIAEEYYREQLDTPAAEVGRRFLTERGFDQEAAARFGVGFAPEGWDSLSGVLRGRGFTEAELTASGLVSQGRRGIYDRFRGRLVWPIRDITGNTIGFGARR